MIYNEKFPIAKITKKVLQAEDAVGIVNATEFLTDAATIKLADDAGGTYLFATIHVGAEVTDGERSSFFFSVSLQNGHRGASFEDHAGVTLLRRLAHKAYRIAHSICEQMNDV
jgi:hypothetical protein